MSLHAAPEYQTPELIEQLKAHGLAHDTPSQLADTFRTGYVAGLAAKAAPASEAVPVMTIGIDESEKCRSLPFGMKLYARPPQPQSAVVQVEPVPVGNHPFSRSELSYLRKILKHGFTQGPQHLAAVREVYRQIRTVWDAEFTEDNAFTTDDILREQFDASQLAPKSTNKPSDGAVQAEAVTDAVDLEAAAKLIYQTWEQLVGFREWMDGGNSHKQDDARRLVGKIRELVMPARTKPADVCRVPVWAVGDKVKAKLAIFDDGEDHHPPGYLCSSGDGLIIRSVHIHGVTGLPRYGVSHPDITNSSFSVSHDEIELAPPAPAQQLSVTSDMIEIDWFDVTGDKDLQVGLDAIYALYSTTFGKPAPDEHMFQTVRKTKDMLFDWWAMHRDEIREAIIAAKAATGGNEK